MISMTGYGYGEYQDEEQHVLLEIRSYNNRYLDVWVNLPQSLNALEPRFREYLVSKIGRGKVELSLRYRIHVGSDKPRMIIRGGKSNTFLPVLFIDGDESDHFSPAIRS